MDIFKKITAKKIPQGFTAEDIRIEASTCTGERVVGFYNANTKKLCHEELVRSDGDIKAFYEKYGLRYKEK